MTLGRADAIAFLATVDGSRAIAFYRDRLGLTLIEDSPFAVVFDAAGTMLRVQKVEVFAPHPFTAFGWMVADIGSATAALGAKGIVFERFAGLEQDGSGVWMSPAGARIAWFKDPDGNLLSLTQLS